MLKNLKSRDDWDEKSLGAKGFTLIELLVVIIILGILAGVAIFAIGGITKKADSNACENEHSTVENAIAAYALVADVDESAVTLANLTTGANAQLKKAPKYWDVAGGEPTEKTGAGFNYTGGKCVFT